MAKSRQENAHAAAPTGKRPAASHLKKPKARAGKETAPVAGIKRPSGTIRMAKPSESRVTRPRGRPRTTSLLQAGPSKLLPRKPMVVDQKAARATAKKARTHLTPKRVAKIVKTLNNERGSTLESIRSKVARSGHETSTAELKKVLAKAVNAKLLKELHEERFSLTAPPASQSRPIDQPSTSASASSGGRRKALPTAAQQGNHKADINPKASCGEAADPKEQHSADAKKRRLRRPPRGRRPVEPGDRGRSDNDDVDDSDSDDSRNGDKGTGDGDLDDQMSDDAKDDIAGNAMSRSEPMSGFESVKVFGTY